MKLPAFWSAAIFITGIWMGRSINLPDLILFLVAVAGFVAGLVIYLKRWDKCAWVLVAVALFITGVFRINLDSGNYSDNDISHFNDLGTPVIVCGEIVREPDLRPRQTYLILRADTIIINTTRVPTSGQILIRLKYPGSAFNYADYVRVTGFLSTPLPARNPGAFDYRKYLQNKNIRSLFSIGKNYEIRRLHSQSGNIFLSGFIIPLRNYILSVFNKYLSEPHNSLISGFLIGETRFIPPEIFKNFRDTGTLHLLAVSGSNVAVVSGSIVFLLLLLRVPLRRRYMLSFIVIVIFCYLSYNQPSVIRASVMVSLFLIGRLAYRKVNYFSLIATAAMLILVFEPLMLWDVGFQLSFVATLGLIYLLPLVLGRIKFRNTRMWMVPKLIIMIFFSSLIAQLAVAPILAYNFNTIPIIGVISNLVIVPLSSLAVVVALMLSFAGWLAPLAKLLSYAADLISGWTIDAVNYFAGLPVVKINLSSPEWHYIILYYLILLLLFNLLVNRSAFKYLILSILLSGNLIVWSRIYECYRTGPTLTVLDSGSSQMVHFETKTGSDYLFLNYDSTATYDPVERVLVPYLIEKNTGRIEYFISRPDDSGPDVINVLKNNDITIADISGQDFRSKLESENCYYKFSCNDQTVVILTEITNLQELISLESERVQLLILPEPHSFKQEICDQIMQIKPEIIVFSGYENLFVESPEYAEFSGNFREIGISCYNTRVNGAVAITFETSGIIIKTYL